MKSRILSLTQLFFGLLLISSIGLFAEGEFPRDLL